MSNFAGYYTTPSSSLITVIMNTLRTLIIILAITLTGNMARANESAASLTDSLSTDIPAADSVAPRRNIVQKVLDYFKDSNKPKEYKKFDFSVIGGPHYSSDTKFGIGLVAAGFYRNNLADSITTPSNVSLYGDVSTVGFYMIGVRGDHIFPRDRQRIEYNLYFYSFPRKFWGIGYEQGLDMDNESKFNELFINGSVDYMFRLRKALYIGPALEFAYARATKRHRPELWMGQRAHTATFGVGFRLQYDTRDNLTATQNGMLAVIEQRFAPRFLGNDYAFSYTDLRFCYFHRAWKDAIIAGRYHAKFNYGNVPWALMAKFGGSNSMRGYYDGRFRDKCEMDITLELRQHVWRRNGIVVWGGLGTIFPKFSEFSTRHLLPNGGIGYRWEFKQRTNVRLDFGIGRGERAFIFSINEAF